MNPPWNLCQLVQDKAGLWIEWNLYSQSPEAKNSHYLKRYSIKHPHYCCFYPNGFSGWYSSFSRTFYLIIFIHLSEDKHNLLTRSTNFICLKLKIIRCNRQLKKVEKFNSQNLVIKTTDKDQIQLLFLGKKSSK